MRDGKPANGTIQPSMVGLATSELQLASAQAGAARKRDARGGVSSRSAEESNGLAGGAARVGVDGACRARGFSKGACGTRGSR
jgi:hypothetical protein